MEEPAHFERRGNVALFVINRPDQRNAIDPAASRRMNELMTSFEADDELLVGVITGAGRQAFSAGADLKAVAAGQLDAIVDAKPGGFAGVARGERKKPLVAAVNGILPSHDLREGATAFAERRPPSWTGR